MHLIFTGAKNLHFLASNSRVPLIIQPLRRNGTEFRKPKEQVNMADEEWAKCASVTGYPLEPLKDPLSYLRILGKIRIYARGETKARDLW